MIANPMNMSVELPNQSDYILLIEDNQADAELVRIALDQTRVVLPLRHANRLQNALELMKDQVPEVVLLDLGLPDAAGMEGIDAICRHTTGVPIVVLTGNADDTTAKRAIECGAQDFLVKGDYSPELLARVMVHASERKRAEQQLIRLARHDSLTGLPNRSAFLDLLEHAIARAKRNHESLAVMFIDLDHFKNINDNLGHHAGDHLLRMFAKRLKSTLRTTDVVARLGGDEFTVLVEDLDAVERGETVARKIITSMRAPFRVDETDIYATPSIGIAAFPSGGNDAATLLKRADMAMYRAKSRGRNTFEFYSWDIDAEMRESFKLDCELREALTNDQFELYYQPIIDRKHGRVSAVEALLRWNRRCVDAGNDTVSRLVPPDHFIPALERTGLIREVGEWVLHQSCLAGVRWRQLAGDHLRIAVNVSPQQLTHTGFVDQVRHALHDSGLPASALELEITEQVLLANTEANMAILTALREFGVTIAIDDFGAGYSSLSYLTVFPFDTVKIDRSFVSRLPEHKDSAVVAAGMVAIAQGLGRRVVAEGIETEGQQRFLVEHDCQELQGYRFSRPLPAAGFEDYLRRSRQPTAADAIMIPSKDRLTG